MTFSKGSAHGSCCGNINRRSFLADCGMGFTGLVLGAMLNRDGIVRASEPPSASSSPTSWVGKAKSVIWIYMIGGVSHLESFDPKPEINKYAGKTIAESPYQGTLDSPFLKQNLRVL